MVGERPAQSVAEHYSTLGDLMDASATEMEQLPGVREAVAESVAGFFADERNRQVIRELRGAGLTLRNPSAEGRRRPLEGLTIIHLCGEGSLGRWTRSEAQRLVERLGGRATSRVSGETDYVVAGPGPGSELDEAGQRGVAVIDQEEFSRMVGSRQ